MNVFPPQMMRYSCLIVLIYLGVVLHVGSDIQTPTNYELLKEGKFGSQLYRIVTSGSSYAEDPYLLNALAPTSYAQGFDAGYLLGNEFIVNYNSLLVALFGDEVCS